MGEKKNSNFFFFMGGGMIYWTDIYYELTDRWSTSKTKYELKIRNDIKRNKELNNPISWKLHVKR